MWSIPPGESQSSQNIPLDSLACVAYSTVHSIESQLITLGINTQFSERFLAKLDGTTSQGAFVENAYLVVKNIGLVEDPLWPEPTQFTWDQYYSAIPQNVIDEAKPFLTKYSVSFQNNIPLDQLSEKLKFAPVQAVLIGNGMNHIVCMLDEDTIFDSYPHFHDANGIHYTFSLKAAQLNDPALHIQSIHQIIIKQKNMQLVNDNGTYFLTGELGKIGIADPLFLAKLKEITANENSGSTANLPQKGVAKQGIVIVDN